MSSGGEETGTETPWRFAPGRQVALLCVIVMLLVGLFPAGARADRNVLAPRGLIASPGTVRLEYLARPTGQHGSLGWLTAGLPQQDLGVEAEVERSDLQGLRRETLSLQYSLTGNAFSDLAPALSVGVRDALNRGFEGRSFYAAATKTFGLSRAQERLVRNWQLNVGAGSGRLGGAFVGAQAQLTLGFRANVEYLSRRVNATLACPLGRYLELKAYSLDGTVYYGASLALIR